MLRLAKWLSFLLLYLFHSVNARTPPAPVEDYNGDIYAGLDPWMVALIVIAIVALFVFGFSILVRRWYEPDDEAIVIGDYEDQCSRQIGLDQATIDAFFPVFCYSSAATERYSLTECTVCLGEFSDGEILRLIPKCNHVFHADCIDLWLKSRNSCPVCRAKLDDPPPQSEESLTDVKMVENRGDGKESVIKINERSDFELIEDMLRNEPVLRENFRRSNSMGQLLDLGSKRFDEGCSLARSKSCMWSCEE